MLDFSAQYKLGILQRPIVEQPVQLRPLCRGVAVLILDGDAVDGKSGAIFEPGFHPVGVHAYKKRETVPKYSYRAMLDEIRENDYNLNIPRYVDTFEEEAPVDIQAVKKNIADIEAELAQVQEQMKKYLDELGL